MNWKPAAPTFYKHKTLVFKKAGKVSSFIYQLGESEQLRQPSQTIHPKLITSKETKKKITYLKECLVKYKKLTGHGRGIAAVQVGIPERFAVIYKGTKLITIINPKITKSSVKKLKYPEMCMSVVPVIAPVIRPAWIEFEYYDEKGVLRKWGTRDNSATNRMINRVFQHEIDHLDGIINIDRVELPKELLLDSNPDFYKTATFEEVYR